MELELFVLDFVCAVLYLYSYCVQYHVYLFCFSKQDASIGMPTIPDGCFARTLKIYPSEVLVVFFSLPTILLVYLISRIYPRDKRERIGSFPRVGEPSIAAKCLRALTTSIFSQPN